MTDASPPPVAPSWRRRHWRPLTIVLALLIPLLLVAGWTAITLNYAYSRGELAMVNLPGAMPEIFRFSVRDDSIARILEKNLGKRVSLSYSQHRGVPTSCFGETQYFITNVRLVDP